MSLLLLIVTGCSNDDEYQNGKSSENRTATQVRWYGVKEVTGTVQTRGAADRMKLWAQDPIITVKFLNNPDDPALVEQIKSYAKEWEQYAGVTFQFVESTETALVRIGFDWEGNSWLTWSYTGNDAKMVRSQSEPTAVFGGFNDGYMTDEEIRGDVLRVFGQVLGLEFEQRHGDWDASWWKADKNGVYYAQSYWESMFEDYYENFDWETIRQYVFDPLAGATIVQTDEVDLESIMIWPYYTRKETTTLLANYDLSEKDKEFIAILYPKKEGNTIQIAWVDAGYFVWVNEEKTQLRITAKGTQVEELPDVVDGKQLTSARSMFEFPPSIYLKLKKAPMFDTSNITDFSYMFYFCEELIEVPKYDTHNGILFNSMFSRCQKLETIPQFDVSSGVYFDYMFLRCNRLISVPDLNTSNAISFQEMFYDCLDLFDAPWLDTSKGKNFSLMFMNCSKLRSVPAYDTSSGTSFQRMFWACSSLKSIPLLDVSNGEAFEGMFKYAQSIEELYLKGIGGEKDDNSSSVVSLDLDISSPILNISSLQYMVDNTTGSNPARTINLSKALETQVPASLIAEAAAKNLTIQFIY
ncbi:protein of unknown function, DUF285 [Dysgonomonas macrotermitis]|uniref:Surface protein n=2 Tax=Dysgonomonas macrotermitis TaxID=1346286 RepID=A0A1M4WQ98_9BACT|nr:protein of unknown function, DUF285 [Dysgonomonas macrotermitis]